MRRFRRLVVLLILIAAVVLAVEYAAAPTARRILVEKIKRDTGLTPQVSSVGLSLWRGAATAYDVVLPNFPPFREPTLLQARTITVNLALLPLLSKKVVVQKITLKEAVLTVERNRRGKTNLQAFLKRIEANRGPATRSPIIVDKLVWADSTFRFIDHTAGSPPARLVLEEVQFLARDIDSTRTDDPLPSRFSAQAAIATPRRGRLSMKGRANLFHPLANFDLNLTLESLDLPALQRLYPASPVVFRDGLAYLSTSATCRNYRLNAQNRLVLHRLDFWPRGQDLRVAGLPLQTVVAFLERGESIELEFLVTGDVRNPKAHLPAVEGLIAKAMRDKILAGSEAILQAGKAGATAGGKALKVGKKAGGAVLEGVKRLGSGLKKLFGR